MNPPGFFSLPLNTAATFLVVFIHFEREEKKEAKRRRLNNPTVQLFSSTYPSNSNVLFSGTLKGLWGLIPRPTMAPSLASCLASTMCIAHCATLGAVVQGQDLEQLNKNLYNDP